MLLLFTVLYLLAMYFSGYGSHQTDKPIPYLIICFFVGFIMLGFIAYTTSLLPVYIVTSVVSAIAIGFMAFGAGFYVSYQKNIIETLSDLVNQQEQPEEPVGNQKN